ncbi:MAG: VanZ family protein [Candidatus Sabulitectum sp.]|nr:VanZ family protein [Candidatus Sabulitectum sp.]
MDRNRMSPRASFKKTDILRRLFLVSVALLIVYLSHQPSLKPPLELFPHQDKLFHMVEFGGLGLALVVNSDLFGKKRRKFRMAYAGISWAILDEIHQFFIPGRFCSFHDVLADTAGLFLALWLLSRFYSKSDGN